MSTINLRNFYPWYTQDEFVEVSDEVAAELIADKRYQQTHERTVRRNKVYSLDAEDGTEAAAIVCHNDSPERVFALMERHCGLCRALNSLPETQGRRIDAHFLLGASMTEIAVMDGVSVEAVSKSIEKGLASMKKYLKNFL